MIMLELEGQLTNGQLVKLSREPDLSVPA